MNQAANFIQAVQERQGLMIACPEEIAYRMGYITQPDLLVLAESMGENDYRSYLMEVAHEDPSRWGTAPAP
jgi:glucose-1-phosphate thymidylyltransferase